MVAEPLLNYLPAPYNFVEPRPDTSLLLEVLRYEVGLAQRPIREPPGWAVRPTIRFHLARPLNAGEVPYADFTNRGLLLRVGYVYNELLERLRAAGLKFDVALAERLIPEIPEPLVLRLTRHGSQLDTEYEVDVVEPEE